MRRLTVGKRLEPSRTNRTLVGSFAALTGCHPPLSALGYRVPGLLALVASLPFSLALMKRGLSRKGATIHSGRTCVAGRLQPGVGAPRWARREPDSCPGSRAAGGSPRIERRTPWES